MDCHIVRSGLVWRMMIWLGNPLTTIWNCDGFNWAICRIGCWFEITCTRSGAYRYRVWPPPLITASNECQPGEAFVAGSGTVTPPAPMKVDAPVPGTVIC